VKPDVVLSESVVRFTNGEETAGASNAAAYFAGVVAVMLATEPRAQGYSGNFFSSRGRPIRSASQSYDRGAARRLWDESVRLVGAPVDVPAGVPMR
jgi:hypothetical protein